MLAPLVLATQLVACSKEPAPAEPAKTEAAAGSVQPARTTTARKPQVPLPPGTFSIEYSVSGISIRANAVPVLDILSRLAEQEGFELVTAEADWPNRSPGIEAASLHLAIVELVRPRPYQLVYEFDPAEKQDRLVKVIVGESAFLAAAASCPPAGAEATPDAPAASRAAAEDETEALSPEMQQKYLRQLQDPSPELRAEAAKHIDPTGEALGRLTRMILKDPSPEVRAATTWALENSEDPLAMDALVMALEDDNAGVIIEVIDSLAYAGDETSIPRLRPFLEHPDERVRKAAADAIEFLE